MAEVRQMSSSQLEEFQQNGYIVLKGILDPAECEEFDVNSVQPALRKYAGIDPKDCKTWNTEVLRSMATGDFNKKQAEILPGVMVRKENGHDPIPDDRNLDLSSLEPILDQLHGGSQFWEYLHDNVGWIHVRFPLNSAKRLQAKDMNTWHVDGGHFTPHFMDSPEQSVIVLPMIRPVGIGGGNTVALKKSHIYMSHKLAQAGNVGIPREVTQNANHIASKWPEDLIVEIAPCEVGDILLMHPFLVHTAGLASLGHPLRVSFNVGLRWKRKPVITECVDDRQHKICWLEKCFTWSLQQSLVFLEGTSISRNI